MKRQENTTRLELLGVEQQGQEGGQNLMLQTTGGRIQARYHGASSPLAIVWVFGSGGGLGGPAGGLYERLGSALASEGRAASLQVDYREPGRLSSCVADLHVGLDYMRSMSHTRFILAGHSFGGAVVITAGARTRDVIGVAALSSQTRGTDDVSSISPRPLFVAHGEADEILPWSCSASIYHQAQEPKTLKLYPGCFHGLDACRDALDRDLMEWLRQFWNVSGGNSDCR